MPLILGTPTAGRLWLLEELLDLKMQKAQGTALVIVVRLPGHADTAENGTCVGRTFRVLLWPARQHLLPAPPPACVLTPNPHSFDGQV